MSTKIYNGIKFKSNDIHVVFKQLMERRKSFTNNANKSLEGQMSEICLAIIDDKFPNKQHFIEKILNTNEYDPYTAKYFIIKAIEYNINKKFRTRDDINYKSTIIIVPHNGLLYGLYYCDDIEDNENFIFEIADDFHYQNQTDPPEDIPYEEYSERGDIWNEIMSETYIPNEFGMELQLTLDRDIQVSDELVDRIIEHLKNIKEKWVTY